MQQKIEFYFKTNGMTDDDQKKNCIFKCLRSVFIFYYTFLCAPETPDNVSLLAIIDKLSKSLLAKIFRDSILFQIQQKRSET